MTAGVQSARVPRRTRLADSIARLENTDDRTPRQAALLAELKGAEVAGKRTDDLDRQHREAQG